MRLEGMKAMVTGAASGFGAGIARALAAEGALVMVTDLNAEGAAAVAVELPGAASCAVDVTVPETLEAAVAACEAQLGGLNIMVANAGIGQRPAPLADTGADVLRQQFEVNAVGAANTCAAALPALRRSDAGASILITVSGIALMPRPGLYGYGMSKMAAMYLMKALALELAPERIRVNGLFPAVGDTPMLAEFAGGERTAENEVVFAEALPLGRLITPEDVGAAAVWLSSPREAGAMTGCALPVDAGRCI
ncbi:MAG: SDR family oxidoreductase [Pikeienuella sp.]